MNLNRAYGKTLWEEAFLSGKKTILFINHTFQIK